MDEVLAALVVILAAAFGWGVGFLIHQHHHHDPITAGGITCNAASDGLRVDGYTCGPVYRWVR